MEPPVKEKEKALALHRSVPPHRWCVTRADLQDLRCAVQEGVAKGSIVPTELDAFDPKDDVIGPCIHTVTQQLIKPVTDEAGRMSWALMLHPEGLACDLFVTHCWQEGVYEFIDKVLNSWPRGAKAAYCCMLSNPQNLDISSLISSPGDSPFAHALRAADYMLVVPNEKCSIYSRIWCAYEAFLAYTESTFIFTASAPLPKARRAIACIALTSLLLAAAAMAAASLLPMRERDAVAFGMSFFQLVGTLLQTLAFISVLAAGFLPPHGLARLVIRLAAVSGGFCLGIQWRVLWDLSHEHAPVNELATVADMLMSLGICASAACAEGVRLRRQEAAREARQLRRGYSGVLRDAQSSVAADKEHILAELQASGREWEVDEAVQVLLDAGMSTPTLRAAGHLAGKLRLAGYMNWATVALSLFGWSYLPLKRIGTIVDVHKRDVDLGQCASAAAAAQACISPWRRESTWISAFGLLQAGAWLMLFVRLPRDRKGFAAATLARFAMLWGALMFWGYVGLQRPPEEFTEGHVAIQLVMAPMVLLLSALGPYHTARIPKVGPVLVRHLLSGISCGNCCRGAKVHPSSASSSDVGGPA